MGWRFRQTFKVLPGVRLNVSKSGISASIGGAPFTLNVGPKGMHRTLSIPGTGLSVRDRIGPTPPSNSPTPSPLNPPLSSHLAERGEEIRSAGTDVLTSAALSEFKSLLLQAGKECVAISGEISTTTPRAEAARAHHQKWERGFLFKRIRKSRFAQLGEEADTAEAQLSELREQLQLARLATEIDIEPDVAASYARLCDAFAAMTQSKRIWDTLSRKATNQVAERTVAKEAVTREPVAFRRGQSDILSCRWEVPCLENRSGGDLYLYPAFVLYRVTKDTFAVIDVQDVTIEFASTRCIEQESIPADSPTVGHTWLKVNKDGSPDKRFKDNVQIPIVQYGCLKLKSDTGLNEEYMLSNAKLSQEFAGAWASFRKSFSMPQAS